MTFVAVLFAIGLIAAPVGRRSPRSQAPPRRLVLLLLAVELRSGRSVLAALQETSSVLDDYAELQVVTRLATVSGLTAAVEAASDELRPVLIQLTRAQRSGAPLVDTVRRMIERDIADRRAVSLSRARALPVKLMIPLTLLMLPGLILMTFAPTIFGLLDDFGGGLL